MSEIHKPEMQKDNASLEPEDYKEYFQCTALRSGWVKEYIEQGKNSFIVNQEVLQLNKAEEVDDETQPSGKRIHTEYGIYTTTYHCDFVKSDNFNSEKPTILLCIKDNLKLLTYTLDNLREHGVDDEANVMIIEDGNGKHPKLDLDNNPLIEQTDIQRLTLERKYSYLSMTYGNGFNFSMLNNVGAAVADGLGCKEVVLWNSDLWAPDSKVFPAFLEAHRENKAEISGAKLLYPDFDWGGNEGIQATDFYFKAATAKQLHRGTCQHGGIMFTLVPILKRTQYMPQHEGRFADKDDPLVNCDKGTYAVTGAFQIIDLAWFKSVGGLNPCLDRGFQDIDLCLRSKRVMYLGKDKFLYHNESVSLFNGVEEEKEDEALQVHQEALFKCGSIYTKIWNMMRFSERVIFRDSSEMKKNSV